VTQIASAGRSDDDGIHLLVASLGQHQDARSWDEFGALLTSDCVMYMPNDKYQGREAIVDFLQSTARGQHMLSLPKIVALADDRARVDTPQMFFRFPELGAIVAGSYRDVVVKTDTDGWLLSERTVLQACVLGDQDVTRAR
jgi:hypothetical protein